MRRRLEAQADLTMIQDTVQEILVADGAVIGVRGKSGRTVHAAAVILATGTFLNGLIHLGEAMYPAGRAGEDAALGLTDSLKAQGLEIARLKTGTPPRIDGRTVRLEAFEARGSDLDPQPFSYATDQLDRPDVPCYAGWTNPRTHQILRANLHRAPLYTGQIASTGPRYCPSIETKIDRFPDKDRHPIILEPEGLDTPELYCNGVSTSVPMDVQEDVVHSIAGLEAAVITRYGYAIEYDFVPPRQLQPSLETKRIRRLYLAGQINGTSGYEEAAGQGLLAGVNAVRQLRDEAPLILRRDEAYLGVLIDDLVTKGTEEPYRMFTSRAEYRLLLRQDNADRRLMRYGHDLGLIAEAAWERLQEKEARIRQAREILARERRGNVTLEQRLRRPSVTLASVEGESAALRTLGLSEEERQQVEIETKYAGYIDRQQAQAERLKQREDQRIPADLDYGAVVGLSNEGRQKLVDVQPATLGQAGRISGVTPADLSVLMVWLKAGKRA